MPGPYVTLDRRAWAALADATEIDLDEATLAALRGLGDPTSAQDVTEVYRPLTQLIHLYMANTGRLYAQSNDFLGLNEGRTPFVIGVAGSVAVGKSTTSRLLQELLRRAPGHPRVDLITTDGFLYPNEELERRGLLDKKGFPESYNRRALLQFVMDVKSGEQRVEAPVYSHMIYDIDPADRIVVECPDILIVEGLNVLQPARVEADGRAGLAVSDFFDFTVYVDADEEHVKAWFIERFMELRRTAFQDERSYFKRFAELSGDEARDFGDNVWEEINGPNLRRNIAPLVAGQRPSCSRTRRRHRLHHDPQGRPEAVARRRSAVGAMNVSLRLQFQPPRPLPPRRSRSSSSPTGRRISTCSWTAFPQPTTPPCPARCAGRTVPRQDLGHPRWPPQGSLQRHRLPLPPALGLRVLHGLGEDREPDAVFWSSRMPTPPFSSAPAHPAPTGSSTPIPGTARSGSASVTPSRSCRPPSDSRLAPSVN